MEILLSLLSKIPATPLPPGTRRHLAGLGDKEKQQNQKNSGCSDSANKGGGGGVSTPGTCRYPDPHSGKCFQFMTDGSEGQEGRCRPTGLSLKFKARIV